MKLKLSILLPFVALLLTEVLCRPSVHLTERVCDARQFLNLYQRTCVYYGKRDRNSNTRFIHGMIRFARDVSNYIDDPDPAPELARKCCEEGCSVELIALHCNRMN